MLVIERVDWRSMRVARSVERARREDQQRGEQADELAGQQQRRERMPAPRIRQRQQEHPERQGCRQQNAMHRKLNAGNAMAAVWTGGACAIQMTAICATVAIQSQNGLRIGPAPIRDDYRRQ